MNIYLAILIALSFNAFSHDHSKMGHAPTTAPLGIMGDHIHSKGKLMLSYRFMKMTMSDFSTGERIDEYFDKTSYMMAPKKMDMSMHMFGAMYGISENTSVFGMVSLLNSSMDMVKKMGRDEVESRSEGVSDSIIGVLYGLDDKFILRIGLLLPTGNIEIKDNQQLLGFGMQTGSGSYGVDLLATKTWNLDVFDVGVQGGFRTFLSENSQDYTLGNTYLFNVWLAYQVISNSNLSLRLNQSFVDPIIDNSNNTMPMSSAMDSANQHGSRTNMYVGIDYMIHSFRLGLEYGIRLNDELKGYQLKRDSELILGVQKVF